MKYSQWRPIGVCDQGTPNTQKAKIFSQSDFSALQAPGIDRNTWQYQKNVLKIIHKYAKDVAKISPLTQKMKQPVVKDIKLVGMVLDFKKTPGLNQESQEGKVQLFQVSFEDAGQKKSWFSLKLILISLSIFLCLILALIIYSIDWTRSRVVSSQTVICDPRQPSYKYLNQLKEHQELMRLILKQVWSHVPYNHQACLKNTNKTEDIELQLIQCYHQLQQNNSALMPDQELQAIGNCVYNLCSHAPASLRSVCQ
ncbi:MAG: hypothetical protein HQM12_10920 [SAR324 cluster bacterium]|nr:hypothetical protein [SAR324 cluster bacterium]